MYVVPQKLNPTKRYPPLSKLTLRSTILGCPLKLPIVPRNRGRTTEKRNEMLQLSLSFIILASQISIMRALPLQLDPDPAAIQPSVVFPTASPLTTIPAFPEQSVVTSGGTACPLDLSDDLIAGISASCSPRHRRPATRARCCPSLAAGLYSAYAASTLSATSYSRGNLPELPDDSESCASAAERTITARGVELPRVNTTCGAAYCYCGIRLRRLSCSFAAAAGVVGVQDKWAPPGVWARRLKKDCALPGLAGCSLCLRALNELKGTAGNDSSKDRKSVTPRDNDCQLMGLTWLLSRNRTRYLQTATAVLRAFMAAESGASGSSGAEVWPSVCHHTREEMPIAVGSSEIGDDGYNDLSAAAAQPPILLLMCYALLYVAFFLSR
ncbi:uncharacterized GPI-anchored protein At4g28100-like isoform X1 [Dendrobium catenatum]|uniref:Putative GPI-anchored protein n=1 Tax=Dendrobium catenatum TaxID=906689 RepID=A0A2I0VBA5_9ASPA|nr:uncharacterized GPI-anchored protein At4g28100-like isoform X1 [Dendrobium catenatum]PKU60692.1 putative GPI-anchored protein [Dendrobium catenatum]